MKAPANISSIFLNNIDNEMYDKRRELAAIGAAMLAPQAVSGKPFFIDSSTTSLLQALDEQVIDMWATGKLSPPLLLEMYQQVKLDELYHSNRIEGNSLTYGETVELIQANKEIQGKSLRDQQEARNLSAALDYVHEIGTDNSVAITQNVIRRIHSLILMNIQADAGKYRTTQIEVTGSRFAPPEAFQVPSNMTALSDYVRVVSIPDTPHCDLPLFSAAVVHVWLAQIHPFTDGNGRAARALMNLILMRRGYPPCIITEEDRPRNIDALENSWENGDLTLFIELLHENINEQCENRDWLVSLKARLEQIVSPEVESEYRIWRNAMTYLKSLFRHTIDNLGAKNMPGRLQLRFIDYGELGLAKYDSLRSGIAARKTRYFGIEATRAGKRQLYAFEFGVANTVMRQRARAVLVLTVNPSANSIQLDQDSATAKTDIYQLGYDLEASEFVEFAGGNRVRELKPQAFMRHFFEDLLPLGLRA